jgi:hypothetical protein
MITIKVMTREQRKAELAAGTANPYKCDYSSAVQIE